MKPVVAAKTIKYPKFFYNNGQGCLAVFGDEQKSISASVIAVFENYCLRHGSSLQGRMESFRYLTKSKQKAAVLLDEIEEILYFPTMSYENPECVWICYNLVADVKGNGSQTRILFQDGFQYTLDIDIRTIRLQMKRCEQFLDALNHADVFMKTV